MNRPGQYLFFCHFLLRKKLNTPLYANIKSGNSVDQNVQTRITLSFVCLYVSRKRKVFLKAWIWSAALLFPLLVEMFVCSSLRLKLQNTSLYAGSWCTRPNLIHIIPAIMCYTTCINALAVWEGNAVVIHIFFSFLIVHFIRFLTIFLDISLLILYIISI